MLLAIYDVNILFFQMLTYLMVARVAQLCPGAVLTKLDKLVEPLKLTVTTKVKANAVKQEYEKQDELKRSAMRAVAALMHVPGAGKFETHSFYNNFFFFFFFSFFADKKYVNI